MSVVLKTISCATKINSTAKIHVFFHLKGGLRNAISRIQSHNASSSASSSVSSNVNVNRLKNYMQLTQPDDKCTIQYIWIDSTGVNMRAKTKVLDFVPEVVCQVPVWSYDGSSTSQAKGKNSDIYLVPVAMYPDPFRGGENKIVLCETYDHEKNPTPSNLRKCCFESMEKVADEKPWFGIEQEYVMMNTHPKPWPHMWPEGYPAPQGHNSPYYCAVGAGNAYARHIVEAHLRVCLYCGLNVAGINAEALAAQWEFQIGPSEGIAAADELWVGRYLLHRVAEEVGVAISFDPKPVEGDWSGTGGHVNFSTEKMREDGGLAEIEKALKKLEAKHAEHLKVYDPKGGKDNERRMTGKHDTSSLDKFTWAVDDRGVSARINREVHQAKKGYFEDRRPAGNADPYAVCNALVCTVLL